MQRDRCALIHGIVECAVLVPVDDDRRRHHIRSVRTDSSQAHEVVSGNMIAVPHRLQHIATVKPEHHGHMDDVP